MICKRSYCYQDLIYYLRYHQYPSVPKKPSYIYLKKSRAIDNRGRREWKTDNARQFGTHASGVEVGETDRITIRQPEVLLTRKSLKSLEYHAKLSHLIVDRLSSFADMQVKCLLMIYLSWCITAYYIVLRNSRALYIFFHPFSCRLKNVYLYLPALRTIVI